jgi:hypothetical protein
MSRDGRKEMGLFGRKKEDEWEEPNPRLDAELERVSALALPQLASEVMTKGFSADDDPTLSPVEADFLVDDFCPRPRLHIMRDSTIHAQKHAAAELSDPNSNRAKFARLEDLIGEGLQALEKVSLVQQKQTFDGITNNVGYVTTRLGRDAIQHNAIDRILAGGTL